MSKDCCGNIENVIIRQPVRDNYVTDHKALLVTLKLNIQTRGPGYWKLNNDIIKDEPYQQNIKQIIQETISKHSTSLDSSELWELLKINIKEFSISYSNEKSLKEKAEVKSLQNELDSIDNEIMKSRNDQGEKAILEMQRDNIQAKLVHYYENKAKGYYIRARAKSINEGEINSKVFLGLEQQRQGSNVIRKIQTENGFTCNNKGILTQIQTFYKTLYKSKIPNENHIKSYLDSLTFPTVSKKHMQFCENHFSQAEAADAVNKLKCNKSPGLDGLTPEFYQTFWPELKFPYLNMISDSLSKGILPSSMRQSVVTLIFKKGDNTDLKNYRPISLSNYDYKILSFMLANRLQKVMNLIVSKDQSGYIKNRNMSDNVVLINSIIEYCQKFNKPAALIFLDFEKAFDSVEWKFMQSAIKKFGLGRSFLSWIKTLYSCPSLVVKNNGWFSGAVKMERGIRQGCPLSALLFILCVECLSLKLKGSKEISGVKIGNVEYRLSQYADDSALILKDKQSIINALTLIDEFSLISGLSLNISKCEGMWLGTLCSGDKFFNGLSCDNKVIKYLGIYVGYDQNECNTKNWKSKLLKFENILLKWKSVKLSLFGKVKLINSLAIPLTILNMSILHTPLSILKNFEKLIFNFLWGKTDKIKRYVTTSYPRYGGLGVVDIFVKEKALKAVWMTKLYDPSCIINNIFVHYLNNCGITLPILLQMNFRDITKFEMLTGLPVFFKEIISAYNTCKYIKPLEKLSNYEFLTQIIWGNELFKMNNTPLCFKHWIKSGLIFVKDLLNENGELLNEAFILSVLQTKNDWIREIMSLKKVFRKLVKKFDTKSWKYTNTENIYMHDVAIGNNMYALNCLKAKTFYSALLMKNYSRPYTQHMWEQLTNTKFSRIEWQNIYVSNAKLKYPKFAEFKYKILMNILSCGEKISKWNPTVSKNCQICGESESISHLLFYCKRLNNLWRVIGEKLKLSIQLKHIIFGLQIITDITYVHNLIIVITSFSIYKSWINCSFNNIDFKMCNLQTEIKVNLAFYNELFKFGLPKKCHHYLSSVINDIKEVLK